MCGITGICNCQNNRETAIHTMNDCIINRGPDAEGIWCCEDDNVALGHRRLSIVDLSDNGKQPFFSASGRFVMVFNGEIYNYKKIREELISEGYVSSFRSNTDTEVLLEAVEAYGIEEAISKCKGMFAIAIYDRRDKKVTLIRDRMGEKPLYYGFIGEKFVFASDISCFKVLDGFVGNIDRKVLGLYFSYGCIPAPYTIYEGINKLNPGEIVSINAPYRRNSITITKYWNIDEIAKKGENNLFKGSIDEAAGELEKLLKQSLKDQMEADVPVGAFLSGGVDSSTVVSVLQSLSPDRKVNTYTIGLSDCAMDESKVAAKTAELLGTNHIELFIDSEDAKNVIPKIPEIFSEPFADSSQIPTYIVSALTKKQVTVAISGDGGDELFCGYNHYIDDYQRYKRSKRVPDFIRNIDRTLLKPLYRNVSNKDGICKKLYLLSSDSLEDFYYKEMTLSSGGNNLLNNSERYLSKYELYKKGLLKDEVSNLLLMSQEFILPDDILTKVDRTAMSVSLETRIPLFDRDIVEFSWTLPFEYKYDGVTKKKILRKVLERYLPIDSFNGPKSGFSIPINKWLNEGKLKEWAEDILLDKSGNVGDILNYKNIKKMWDDYNSSGVWSPQIWYALMFKAWLVNNK